MYDLEEDGSRSTVITQLHKKPLAGSSGCCKSDRLTNQKVAGCWISTGVSLKEEVNEEWPGPQRLESKAVALDHFLTWSNRELPVFFCYSDEAGKWESFPLIQLQAFNVQ